MIPSVGYTFNSVHYTGSRNSNDMIQTYLDDSSLRLMGMLMTISLGIFTVLFLYVLYNMTVSVAGTTIAMLFFVALAFFIVLMKTFKLLGKFVSHSQTAPEYDAHSGISTISEIISHNRTRHDSAPPPYEEAIKNCPIVSRTIESVVVNIPTPPPPATQNINCGRCTVQISPE